MCKICEVPRSIFEVYLLDELLNRLREVASNFTMLFIAAAHTNQIRRTLHSVYFFPIRFGNRIQLFA